MALYDANVAHWSANQMKQLARQVFDEDGENMLTFGLFGRRSIDSSSPVFDINVQNNTTNDTKFERRPSYKQTNREMIREPVISFPDDSSGVTDVSASIGSDSSYSNESYNSYEGNKQNFATRPEISSPQRLQQYKEVCSLKYDPKIRCRCSECKSRLTPKHVETTPIPRKPLYGNEQINAGNVVIQRDHAKLVNGQNQYTGQPLDTQEPNISSLRRNARRYRSYTPKSQKEMTYQTLQINRDRRNTVDEGRKAYADDFVVRYDNRQPVYRTESPPYVGTRVNHHRVQEQTAGYFGDREDFDSFPGKYFETYSQVYPPPNKYGKQGNDLERKVLDSGPPAYPVNDSINSTVAGEQNTPLSKELQQIEAEYHEIEQRLKKEKFYRRSYIAAQDKDTSRVKQDDTKLSVLYKKNGPLKDNVKSPTFRSKSLTGTPISSPGSATKEKVRSGRSTPSGKNTSEDEKSLSPRSERGTLSPKLRLLRTTSLRKGGKKKAKLERSKSFSEGEKKVSDPEEKPKSPNPSMFESPSVPKETPCFISVPSVRRQQIYHLDEEDSPEDGIPAILDQLAKYQNENKAVPLFLNVIQDLRTAHHKLLKESGKLEGENSNSIPNDIIRKHSVQKKPSYSDAAKRSLETGENKEASNDENSPVSPIPGKIRLNGDELFYKVSLRRKSTDQSPEKPLSLNENGNTPIHRAAQNGNLDILQILVLNGGDVNSLNSNGWPALHLSLQSYHFRSALFLIEAGADLKDYTDRRVQEYHKVQRMARRYFQYLETEL